MWILPWHPPLATALGAFALGAIALGARPWRAPLARAFALALGIDDVALAAKAMTEVRYEGYITRMHSDIRRAQDHERVSVPMDLDPAGVTGLRGEAVEVLRKFRPATLGQAGRLAGINPADVSLLAIAIKRHRAAAR